MSDTAAGMQFSVLGPTDSVDDGRVSEFYAYPDGLQRPWVRANMIASVDGGATADGKAGGMAEAGDRALFRLMRYAADVIVVGAATVRVENYSGAQVPVAHRSARQRRGQAEVPPIAVVTQSGNLDPDARFFTHTETRPVILTCTDSFGETHDRLNGVADVVDASGSQADRVDATMLLKILAERGLYRVLSEGGPQVLGMFIENDQLDELCLTVAPLLLGGLAPRIASGPGEVHTRMRPAHLLSDDDGYLYTRYVRAD
ncbi:pyrimidine reductase family protein [Mycolicibacterium sp. XJ662]